MEILQVCPYTYGIGTGGVARYVQNISERLAENHHVTVYATDATGKFPRESVVDGVRVERFRRFAPGRAYFLSWDMLLKLRKSNFDIVHAHSYHALPMHFSVLAKCKRLVVSTHFHGQGSSAFRNALINLLKPLGRRTLRKADRIIAVSDYEKGLLSQFGVDSNKIVTIPCGVDFSEFSKLDRHEKKSKSILYVGSLESYKGTEGLVEVLPKLAENVMLEVVGKGPVKGRLQRRALELGVKDRVRFYSSLPRDELLQKYLDADVFVLLSKYEAYSMAVAEALVAGLPCIVARTSALTEWIDNLNCIGLDYPIDINELAKLIKGGINDRRVDWKMGYREKIIDWREVVKRLEHAYLD